jgi:hypothetical protein
VVLVGGCLEAEPATCVGVVALVGIDGSARAALGIVSSALFVGPLGSRVSGASVEGGGAAGAGARELMSVEAPQAAPPSAAATASTPSAVPAFDEPRSLVATFGLSERTGAL